jgi:hypothetical protein
MAEEIFKFGGDDEELIEALNNIEAKFTDVQKNGCEVARNSSGQHKPNQRRSGQAGNGNAGNREAGGSHGSEAGRKMQSGLQLRKKPLPKGTRTALQRSNAKQQPRQRLLLPFNSR